MCYFGELQEKICSMLQQGTEKSMFRVIFRIGFDIITTVVLQNTISKFNLILIESVISGVCYFRWATEKNLSNVEASNREDYVQVYLSNWLWHYDYNDSAKYNFQIELVLNCFDSWVCHFGWATKKKSVQCWSKEQRRLCSGLSFKFSFKLWLQLFCKIRFPDLTYFKLKVLIAECFTLKSHDKNICWMSQQGTEKAMCRVIFQVGLDIMTTMILLNAISGFNLFRIKSFDSWVRYYGELRKKHLLNVAARNREENIHSNILHWLWC